MPNPCELSTRTRIRAFRTYQNHLLFVAEGELPSTGFRIDIQQNPIRIFPPQFDLFRCRVSPVGLPVITPFLYAETSLFSGRPADRDGPPCRRQRRGDD